MQAEGRLIGMLDVYARESRNFKSWEKELFATFANHTALSLQRSQWQERDLAAEITKTIDWVDADEDSATEKGENELTRTLRRIAQKCVKATHTRMCHIRLLNRVTNQLKLEAYYDSAAPERKISKENTIPLGKGIVGYVAATGQPYPCPDTRKDKLYAGAHEGNQPISALFVPIKSGKTVIGTLSVGREHVSDFDQGELQLLESIEQQISLAIERAHQSDLLSRLAASAAQAGSLQRFCEQLVILTSELMREPICLVWTLDKDRDGFALKASVGTEA